MMYDSKLKGRLIAGAVGMALLFAMYQWMKSDMPDQSYAEEQMMRDQMMRRQYEHAQQLAEMNHRNMSADQYMRSLDQMSRMHYDFNY